MKSPLEQLNLHPHMLATQLSVPDSLNYTAHTPNHIPHTPNHILYASMQQNGQAYNDLPLNRSLQLNNSTGRTRGYSLDSDQHSKSTESEETNVKEDMASTRMRNFASTPTLKHSKCYTCVYS